MEGIYAVNQSRFCIYFWLCAPCGISEQSHFFLFFVCFFVCLFVFVVFVLFFHFFTISTHCGPFTLFPGSEEPGNEVLSLGTRLWDLLQAQMLLWTSPTRNQLQITFTCVGGRYKIYALYSGLDYELDYGRLDSRYSAA